MKRILIVVVAMVVVFAVALPPLFGARARSLMEDRLATAGEALAPYMTMEVSFDDWDVGWYSSTATVSLAATFDTESLDLEAGVVEFDRTTLPKSVTLYHGPILLRPSAGLGWGSVEFVVDSSVVPELREFEEALGVAYSVRGGVLVGFGGGLSLSMDIPEFAYTLGDSDLAGTEVDFAGLEATARVGGGGGTIDFEGQFGGVDATIFPAQLAWGRTTWTGSARKDDRIANLWLGGGKAEADRVTYSSGGEASTFEVIDLRIEGGNEIEGELLLGTNLYEAREVRIRNILLEDPVVDLAFGYGLEGIARLMEVGYLDSFDPERQMELVADLGRERIDFAINRLGFAHEGRHALASLAIEFRGDELPDGFEIGPNADFTAMLPLVTANLDLAFHRELLGGLGIGQMDGMIRMLAREGILQESGDDYALQVGFLNGGLTVNGDPFEPFELLGLLGGL